MLYWWRNSADHVKMDVQYDVNEGVDFALPVVPK